MGLGIYYRILKVNGKVEIHFAFDCDHEYSTFFVSDRVEATEYLMFGDTRYVEYYVDKCDFFGLKKLFDVVKRILSEKDYELFLLEVEKMYYSGVVADYNERLKEGFVEEIPEVEEVEVEDD